MASSDPEEVAEGVESYFEFLREAKELYSFIVSDPSHQARGK